MAKLRSLSGSTEITWVRKCSAHATVHSQGNIPAPFSTNLSKNSISDPKAERQAGQSEKLHGGED